MAKNKIQTKKKRSCMILLFSWKFDCFGIEYIRSYWLSYKQYINALIYNSRAITWVFSIYSKFVVRTVFLWFENSFFVFFRNERHNRNSNNSRNSCKHSAANAPFKTALIIRIFGGVQWPWKWLYIEIFAFKTQLFCACCSCQSCIKN